MNSINTNKNEEIDIRQAEDSLFEEWALKRHPFATDGCADPKMYHESNQKIVFVLKERNFRLTIEEQRELQIRGCAKRHDEREIFDSWWTLMAQWADVLLPKENADQSWDQIQRSFKPSKDMPVEDPDKWIKERNKEALGKCACIQLKKSPGGGELNKEDFFMVVKEDKDFLMRQFGIYSPHFIVSCGSSDTWSIFTEVLFVEDRKFKQTRNGINYFIIQQDDNSHKTAVINFGHPRMRVNATLWGALAFGLRDALTEIFPQLMSP